MSAENPPPKPRFDFTVQIGASDKKRLVQRLYDLAYELECDLLTDGCWGGAGTHGEYTLTDRGGPTEEEYAAQLHAWRERERAERDAKKGAA